MTRAGGRRILRPTAPVVTSNGRIRLNPGWLAAVLVLITAGALAVAGSTSRPTGQTGRTTEQVALSERQLTCTGGIKGASSMSGVADVRGVGTGVLTRNATPAVPVIGNVTTGSLATNPLVLIADKNVAAGVFASQIARNARWLAFEPCPEPRASWWFVGAGGSGSHDTVLTIGNPRAGNAIFDINVLGPQGPVTAPGLKGLSLSSGATRSFDLGKVAPSAGELAVSITSSRGLVSVSAADSWSRALVDKPVNEWVAPQPDAAKQVDLTGIPAKPGQATLLLANTGTTDALAKVEVVGSTGTFTPKAVPTVSLSPGAVVSVPITSLFDGKPSALRVTSPVPIVATVRSVVNGDDSYATTASALAGSSVAAVPAGVHAELRLSSLGKLGAVTVRTFDAKGREVGSSREIAIPAESAVGVTLSPKARYVEVTATAPQTIGSLLISNSSGIGESVLSPAARALRLPVVHPGA
ncbi:MAG: hypothetical protein JWR35_2929 [Marmoricola sp.]|nr:hypothetical protein [Marmoricola sp.]